MTERTFRILAILTAVAALLVPLRLAAILTAPEPTPVRIEEDSPDWDCHTMGNHICGAVIEPTPHN